MEEGKGVRVFLLAFFADGSSSRKDVVFNS